MNFELPKSDHPYRTIETNIDEYIMEKYNGNFYEVYMDNSFKEGDAYLNIDAENIIKSLEYLPKIG